MRMMMMNDERRPDPSYATAVCRKFFIQPAQKRGWFSAQMLLLNVHYLVMVRSHNTDAVCVENSPRLRPVFLQFTQPVNNFIDLPTDTTTDELWTTQYTASEITSKTERTDSLFLCASNIRTQSCSLSMPPLPPKAQQAETLTRAPLQRVAT